jgi:hypothetical protein
MVGRTRGGGAKASADFLSCMLRTPQRVGRGHRFTTALHGSHRSSGAVARGGGGSPPRTPRIVAVGAFLGLASAAASRQPPMTRDIEPTRYRTDSE